jgi:hypothetical protein
VVDPVAEKNEPFITELRERLLNAIDPIMHETEFPDADEAECGLVALWALATLGVDVALVMGNTAERAARMLPDVACYAAEVEPARAAERMTRHIGGGQA